MVIAAVANSPFGLFFAQERNAPGTLSVAEAVNTVNIAYNAQLEQLQADGYDDIVIQGQAADWPEVLAVFATRYAGADDGVDVATLDPDRVEKLTAVFWDMTAISSWVETIDHPGGEDSKGWTEYILHITISAKTADEMRTAYSFTEYQNSALDELLADRAALSALAGSLSISNADAQAVLDALPEDLSPERRRGGNRPDPLRETDLLLGRKIPGPGLGQPVGAAHQSYSRGQFHHRHLPALRSGLLGICGLGILQYVRRGICDRPWRRSPCPAHLLRPHRLGRGPAGGPGVLS